MKKIILYQVTLIAGLFLLWAQAPLERMPIWLAEYQLAINCILISTLAGVLYCIRGVYLNYSVNDNWQSEWEVWYYIRPLASALAGLIAFIFLKAGIVVLEATQTEGAGNYGYFAFSFIAGYNVDRFLKKIEELTKSTFGVEKSRSYKQGKDDN